MSEPEDKKPERRDPGDRERLKGKEPDWIVDLPDNDEESKR